MNRVVVTGIGVVSPLGIGREAFWNALVAGRSGLGPITLFDASSFPVRIGGEAKGFDAAAIEATFPEVSTTRDRKVLLALTAAEEAIADAQLTRLSFQNAMLSMGVGLETIRLEELTPFAAAADLDEAIARRLADHQPNHLLQTPLDRTATILGNRYGFQSGRWTNCSACAAGTQVMGHAWQMLRRGRATVALAGAADSMLNPLGLGGFSLLRVLSTENDAPEHACRPFDLTRQGAVLGEGAGFLVLETLDHATARGAAIYAELAGYGSSFDAFAVSDPDPAGRGAVQSMRAAMRAAGLGPESIDCVNAHGTGTPKNDAVETAAIKEALGDRARQIPVHAVKSMTGHMIAASGAIETAAAALTLARRIVPPTLNLRCHDPECDLDYVPGLARPFAGKTVLSNSFGFGGQNATVVLTSPQGYD